MVSPARWVRKSHRPLPEAGARQARKEFHKFGRLVRRYRVLAELYPCVGAKFSAGIQNDERVLCVVRLEGF